MTKYRELMEARLKENARTVDSLKKNERIIFQADKFIADWINFGGRGSIGENYTNIYGSDKDGSQTTMKNFKLLMDEHFFSNLNFDVESSSQDTWIFTIIIDKENSASYSIDLGMSSMKGCVKEVKRVPVTERFREEIIYKCEE